MHLLVFALETVLWFVEILLQPAFFTQCDFACLILPLKFFLRLAGPVRSGPGGQWGCAALWTWAPWSQLEWGHLVRTRRWLGWPSHCVLFFFFNLLIFNRRIIALPYCIGFCVRQHASAISIQRSPPWTALSRPPTPCVLKGISDAHHLEYLRKLYKQAFTVSVDF